MEMYISSVFSVDKLEDLGFLYLVNMNYSLIGDVCIPYEGIQLGNNNSMGVLVCSTHYTLG